VLQAARLQPGLASWLRLLRAHLVGHEGAQGVVWPVGRPWVSQAHRTLPAVLLSWRP
jgi:hypothetical protein